MVIYFDVFEYLATYVLVVSSMSGHMMYLLHSNHV